MKFPFLKKPRARGRAFLSSLRVFARRVERANRKRKGKPFFASGSNIMAIIRAWPSLFPGNHFSKLKQLPGAPSFAALLRCSRNHQPHYRRPPAAFQPPHFCRPSAFAPIIGHYVKSFPLLRGNPSAADAERKAFPSFSSIPGLTPADFCRLKRAE